MRALCWLLLWSCALLRAQEARVLTPDWGIAALMSQLGEAPLATGDLLPYRRWVRVPELSGVIDWGARYQPNRELLATLDYDLVLDIDFYFHLRPVYGAHPVHEIDFRHKDRLADAHWQTYAAATRTLGAKTGMTAQAERFLRESRAELARLGAEIRAQEGAPRRFAVVQMSDPRLFYMYAENSLFSVALQEMGLEMVVLDKGGQWGNFMMSLPGLSRLPEDVCLLMVEPMSALVAAELERSYTWQRLGFGRSRCMRRLPAVWVFGGTDAVLHFARALHAALLGDGA